MTKNENQSLLDLLEELATNDELYKHFVNIRSHAETKEVFMECLKKIGKNLNVNPKILDILLTGTAADIAKLIKDKKEYDPHGLWIFIYLLEPIAKK